MKINWAVRFKNKTFVASLFALVVAFAYNLCALFGITPVVEQSAVMAACNAVLTVLGALGVLVDPTTAGISDSARALTYTEPYKEE